MELREIAMVTFPNTRFIPFGISRAPEDDIFLAINRNTIQVLEMMYKHNHDGNCRMIHSSFKASTYIPTKEIDINSKEIYQNASHKERQLILQDLHLMSNELKVNENHIAIASAKWSTRILGLKKHFIACLTTFGGCEIVAQPFTKRKWNRIVCNISELWTNYSYPKGKRISNLVDLKERTMEVFITAISWNNLQLIDNSTQWFAVIAASGTIGFFRLDSISEDIFSDVAETYEIEISIQFTKSFEISKANLLEWFSFRDKFKKLYSFLVIGDNAGDVHLFKLEFDKDLNNIKDVNALQTLFAEGDGILANGFQWNYNTQTHTLHVIFCKGMHLFIYLLKLDGTILSRAVYYVGNLYINGIHKFNSSEYIVASASGVLQSIYIHTDSNALRISSKIHKATLNVSKYAVYGLVGSTNNAFLLAALYVRQPFDHLILREPATVSISHHLGSSVLDKLVQNSTRALSNMIDCAELLRCLQLKNDTIFLPYLQTPLQPIQTTEVYLYGIKVRLIVTSARSTYLRERNRIIESNVVLTEFNALRKIIYAILACQKLHYLNQIRSKLTSFQLTAARCQRNYLREFTATAIVEKFETMRKEFVPNVELLLIETEHFDEISTEKCVYCDEIIDIGKFVCANEHKLPRCCISMVQVQILNDRHCPHCATVAVDNLECLEEIFGVGQKHRADLCNLCDRNFEIYKSGYSN